MREIRELCSSWGMAVLKSMMGGSWPHWRTSGATGAQMARRSWQEETVWVDEGQCFEDLMDFVRYQEFLGESH